jgi:hypothetical protein
VRSGWNGLLFGNNILIGVVLVVTRDLDGVGSYFDNFLLIGVVLVFCAVWMNGYLFR